MVTEILEPEEMPMAKNGLRADILMDPAATVNRTNFSRKYEQYINSVKYDLEIELRARIGVKEKNPALIEKAIKKSKKETLVEAVDRLNHYHDIVSKRHGDWMRNLSWADKLDYFKTCITENIIDYRPPEEGGDYLDIIRGLDEYFPSTYDTVTYKDRNGVLHESKEPIRIGGVYMMLLEKQGFDWSAVSVAKTQQNGVITYTSSEDRYASPTKKQATRVLGEAEIRVVASYGGGEFASDLHDRNNNPVARKKITESILRSHTPAYIPEVVDRNEVPLGWSKPLQIITHLLNCAGVDFTYKPFDPSLQKPAKENIFIDKDELK